MRLGREVTGQLVVITGGAGFIGSNLADRLLSEGRCVLVLDNLARPGVERNLAWLRERHGTLSTWIVDVRNDAAVNEAIARASAVFHLAAQVAVTTSLTRPAEDFEINARGTLNVLEALRRRSAPPPLIFTSTNKVYGKLSGVDLARIDSRYSPEDRAIAERGVSEAQPLDFQSPYGCSKGAADQYVLDYARTYDLPAAVFRMSCIYGPRQLGTEDQGWVAHFLRSTVEGVPVALYGDGMQVRDVLFIDDLVDALLTAERQMDRIAGRAFNIGGGPTNTVSLLELLELIGELEGAPPSVSFHPWRTGDQRWYVSDVRAFGKATGWAPRIDVREGVERLRAWVLSTRDRSPAHERVAFASAP